jgi:hypothetical protein
MEPPRQVLKMGLKKKRKWKRKKHTRERKMKNQITQKKNKLSL